MAKTFTKSAALYERALGAIPLASQTFSKSRMSMPFGVSPLFLERGNGARVWDVDGNEYLDFINALLCVSLGYQDPDVDEAVMAQLKNGVSFSLPHKLEAEVAELLIDLIPSAEQVRFGKNGSDVTAAAIRLARAYTGKEHIAVCGYHGWHDWYIGSTTRSLGVPESTQHLTHSFEFNNLDSLKALKSEQGIELAAVILEPMNLTEPAPGFLQAVRDYCSANNIVLVFDEIITGFRFSMHGAQQLFGVTPDLTTLGKGLANGFPLSAIVGKHEMMALMDDIFFSGTFGGETLSLAAAKACIEKMKRCNLPQHLHDMGSRLKQKLDPIFKNSQLFTLSGHPSWTILQIAHDNDLTIKSVLLQEMYQQGILTLGTHNLSLAHTAEHIDLLVDAYQQIVPEIESNWRQGKLDTMLKGQPIEPVFRVR